LANTYIISPNWVTDARETAFGVMPKADDSSIGTDLSTGWRGFADIVNRSVAGNKLYSTNIVSTYSLIYTAGAHAGGVLAPNGDIHFLPYSAAVGQKISAAGVVSTYSLVYTTTSAYIGGVLAPNGDIHFVPIGAAVGQKISTMASTPFEDGICLSQWFNKF
jgi:hypothetical protein